MGAYDLPAVSRASSPDLAAAAAASSPDLAAAAATHVAWFE